VTKLCHPLNHQMNPKENHHHNLGLWITRP
jgi:hypothetical protein